MAQALLEILRCPHCRREAPLTKMKRFNRVFSVKYYDVRCPYCDPEVINGDLAELYIQKYGNP